MAHRRLQLPIKRIIDCSNEPKYDGVINIVRQLLDDCMRKNVSERVLVFKNGVGKELFGCWKTHNENVVGPTMLDFELFQSIPLFMHFC